jgi:hypothetical protein
MARFCGNCGTEVDETAVFCPTCGQPIDQATETEIPPAPAWPDAAPIQDEVRDEPVAEAPAMHVEEPTRVEAAPPPPAMAPPPPPPPPAERPAQQPSINLPITWPLTLSAWLIGIGALVGALGALIGLFRGTISPIDLLLLLMLLGIAVTVFLAANVPTIPQLRLATMSVMLVGFGIALDRIGLGFAGVGDLLLFLGTAAGAMGGILLELGRDQPLGGPRA